MEELIEAIYNFFVSNILDQDEVFQGSSRKTIDLFMYINGYYVDLLK